MLLTVFYCVAVIKVSPVFSDSDIVQRSKSSDDYMPCDRGWYYFRDNCYRKDGRAVWTKALKQCRDYGGDFVSIHSQEEQDFIIAFLILESEYVSWIGVNDRDNELDYKWTDESVLNYTNWDSDEPTGLSKEDEDCVYMDLHPIGTWNDAPCTEEIEYICKMKANPSKKSRNLMYCSPSEGGGWKYRSSCYHIVSEIKSWENAEMHCKKIYKGHLLSILDVKEYIFLEHALPITEKEIWIGIRIEDHMQHKWTSGWYVSFEKFNKEKKIEEGSCVAWRNQTDWITIPCSRKLPFICKVSKATPPVLKSPPIGSYCPKEFDHWKYFGGVYCYYIQTKTKANFLEARSYCQGIGGDLVSIHSQKEVDILRPFIENTGKSVYIGLIKVNGNAEQIFGWTDGSILDYTNWGDTELNRNEEECVEALSGTMEWKNTLCDNKLSGYICSVKKILPSSNNADGCSNHVSLKTMIGLSVWIKLVISLLGVVV